MRIVLADDSVLIRAGIREILTSHDHDVIRECEDADELVAVVDELVRSGDAPDMVITDVRMPPKNTDDGLRAAIDLRSRHRDLPVLVLSAYVTGPYVRELLSGPGADGAVGYLLKEKVGRVADFLRAVETVSAGGVVIDPEVVRHATRADSPQGPLARLTAREREVLAHMAEGRSNAEIATELFLSGAAVSKHVANVFVKLGMPPDEDNRRVKAILTWFAYN
ncbi:response regulator [Streptomyces griseus]|nr:MULTISPECIES: response regulator transcription factor [Streptomyces]MYR13303.1 response regulator [Streptomyces sp. SID724]MYT80569.1 response regulator [Streptomyces sp. SID8364]MBW3705420.1 DNA-binding response regulator [Streptomyces griseus]NEB56196.1 response regulator transcription factor [Streptomyces griseus]SBV00328.1 two component transcriptional regulator, LuxR family [Streptomyces sp. MnatMP-M77]